MHSPPPPPRALQTSINGLPFKPLPAIQFQGPMCVFWASPMSLWLKKKKKKSICSAGDAGLIPGSGRSPGGGNGNPLQYSCLGNPMDRGACWTIVLGVAKSQMEL